jgi:hypothetical protein
MGEVKCKLLERKILPRLVQNIMKDDIKEDLESKKIGVAEVKGADGDIEALSLKMGEH